MKKTKLLTNCKYVISIAQGEAKWYLLIKLFYALINGVYPLVIIIFPKLIIDCFTNGKGWNGILEYALIWLTFGVIYILLSVLEFRYFRIRDAVIEKRFSLNISEKTVNMDMAIIESNEVQKLLEKCNTVKNQGMCMNLLDDIFLFLKSFISVIVSFTVLAFFDIWIFLALMVFITINCILTLHNKNLNHKAWDMTTEENRKTNYYTATMNNPIYAKEIRMFSLSNWIIKKFEQSKLGLINIMKKFTKTFTLNIVLSNITNTLQEIFLYVYYGACVIFKGMAFGNFTMMISAVRSFMNNTSTLSKTIIQIFDRSNYIDYYLEYLNYPNQIASNNINCVSINSDNLYYTIEFSNVCFSYPKATTNVFENLNIKLYPNNFYVMVGVNGSGKTTFFNLLCRLYDPQNGMILLNGRDIKEYNYQDYRNLFSIVFQDYKYYAFTIAENIALNSYDGSEEIRKQINDCLEKAGLKDKIEKLDLGMDTTLQKIFDNKGIELSGGETQKLALARALFKNTPFLLLDEPSSALDAFAEDDLITRFKEASINKTVVYVSHRLSVAQYADKVIFVNGGTIEGFDTHENLMINNSTYRKLYTAQAKHYLNDK